MWAHCAIDIKDIGLIRIDVLMLYVRALIAAILVLFMVNAFHYSDDAATAIYHTFVVICYLSPVLGAMLSDGWLGKFRFSSAHRSLFNNFTLLF